MGSVRYVAFRGKSWISELIRFVTRSEKYSHIGYLSSRGELIECWPSRNNPFQHWCFSSFSNHRKGTKYEVWELTVPFDVATRTEDFFRGLAIFKTKYDWLGCLGFVFRFVRDAKKRYFCSEGCVKPLIAFLGWTNITASHVSPQDFIELIQAAGGKLVKEGTT